MAKLNFAEAVINGKVEAAAITLDGQIAVVCRSDDGFTYQLIDPSQWQKKPFAADNNLSDIIGFLPLPEIGDKDETDIYTREIADKYNVRFLYEDCEAFDAFIDVGLSAELSTDRDYILHAEKQLVKSFEFLPDEVWKNIGNDLPFVVVLCKSIPGNVGGLSFKFGGYNSIFVEIGGNDDYYTYTFMHEVGHAISNCVSEAHPELLDEWMQLTPQDVLDMVENGTADGINSLTVEFTPDDKTGNVCYVTAYAVSNPEEDRAETLAKIYNEVFVEKDTSLFSHEVLKKKARHWAKMIHETFDLESGTTLMFESI